MASSRVPAGGVLHSRRGSRLAPSQVNARGNVPPDRSGLETVSGEESPWLGAFIIEPHIRSATTGISTGPGASPDSTGADGGPGGPIGAGEQCEFLSAATLAPMMPSGLRCRVADVP